jgi:hypothetical protein
MGLARTSLGLRGAVGVKSDTLRERKGEEEIPII